MLQLILLLLCWAGPSPLAAPYLIRSQTYFTVFMCSFSLFYMFYMLCPHLVCSDFILEAHVPALSQKEGYGNSLFAYTHL